MTAQDFMSWMNACGFKTALQVGEALGWGRNAATRHVADAKAGKDVNVPQYIALAMTAVAQGLKPWDAYER